MLKQSKPVWFLSLFTPRFEKVSITLVTHAVKTRRPSFILKGAMFRCTLRLNAIGEEGAGGVCDIFTVLFRNRISRRDK